LTPREEWKLRNKERLAEYQKVYSKKWYESNIDKYLLYQIRARAKKFGIPFDLELGDVQVPEECPILGIPLFRNVGKNGPCGNSPSVDRIDPKKGYIKGNVWVISQKANTMKSDATIEELERFRDWLNKSTLLSKISTV
jgi:hypothetical protein